MIGLRYVQEHVCKAAMGGSPDPALPAMIRGGAAAAPAATPAAGAPPAAAVAPEAPAGSLPPGVTA
eukprot:1859986-Alexandrium_andersonii.AAC.1